MSFNAASHKIFTALERNQPVGFISGHKESKNLLKVDALYLYPGYADEENRAGLTTAFVDKMQKDLGVTHYKLNDFGVPEPIGVAHLLSADFLEATAAIENEGDAAIYNQEPDTAEQPQWFHSSMILQLATTRFTSPAMIFVMGWLPASLESGKCPARPYQGFNGTHAGYSG